MIKDSRFISEKSGFSCNLSYSYYIAFNSPIFNISVFIR